MRDSSTFPLTRYFVLTSFLTTLVVAAVTSWRLSGNVSIDLLQELRQEIGNITDHLQRDILKDFIEPTLQNGGAIDLEDEEQLARLDEVVQRVAISFDLKDIYIFDAEGTIIFSTKREHMGFPTPADNELYWEALRTGETTSAIRNRGAPTDLQRSGSSSPLLETYVPVTSLGATHGGDGRISNVIETYQDISDYERELHRARRRIVLVVVVGSAILCLALIWIVRRADHLIRDRTSQLLHRNQRLKELSEHLEEEVEKRTHQLIQKEKLASLGTLAAGLAHEINNPLATVSACAEGLRRRLAEVPNDGQVEREEFDQYLTLIEQESFRVKKITGNLLDFSRQKGSGKLELTDVQKLIRETGDLLRVGREIEGVEIVVSGEETARFRLEPTDFKLLVFNLTANAIDAVQERQRARSESGDGTVRWTAREVDQGLVITCKDDGCGFEATESGKLLEPFYTTKEPGKGTGLGLALCHSMAERWGGTLTLQSPGPMLGAEARVFFPVPSDEVND